MKKNKEESARWLKQAEHDLEVAKSNLKSGFYSDACFMCEQTSQKALKAYLVFKTKRPVWEHSVQTLAKKGLEYDEEFQEVVEYGRILDRYYIPTRYPDALTPPAVPYETYIKKDASVAVNLTGKIIKLIKNKL